MSIGRAQALVELDAEGELIETFDVNATEPLFAPSAVSFLGLDGAQLVLRDDRVWISGLPARRLARRSSATHGRSGSVVMRLHLSNP